MSVLRHYVNLLTDDECRAIHADASEWEKRGVIGDGALRHHARQWAVAAGLPEHNITLWMMQLTSEVWRRYASPELERTEPEMATSGENISSQNQRANRADAFGMER